MNSCPTRCASLIRASTWRGSFGAGGDATGVLVFVGGVGLAFVGTGVVGRGELVGVGVEVGVVAGVGESPDVHPASTTRAAAKATHADFIRPLWQRMLSRVPRRRGVRPARARIPSRVLDGPRRA